MKKNVIFVVNPISGDLDKSELLSSVQEFSMANDFNLVVYETTGDDDGQNIQSLYNKYIPQRIDLQFWFC